MMPLCRPALMLIPTRRLQRLLSKAHSSDFEVLIGEPCRGGSGSGVVWQGCCNAGLVRRSDGLLRRERLRSPKSRRPGVPKTDAFFNCLKTPCAAGKPKPSRRPSTHYTAVGGKHFDKPRRQKEWLSAPTNLPGSFDCRTAKWSKRICTRGAWFCERGWKRRASGRSEASRAEGRRG